MKFKRTELPIEEEQFQSLLSTGLIKQRSSEEEGLCKILGIPYKPNPDEIPYFDVDKSIITELLSKGKFNPQPAKTIKINTDMFFGNQFSKEIHVRNTSMYSKLLYNELITEIGFSFDTNSVTQLQNSLNNSGVKNDSKPKNNLVYVPFFITTWDENKDAYHYANLELSHFEHWLKAHFSHCNIPHAMNGLLNEYRKNIQLDDNEIINSLAIKEAISQIKSQLVDGQKGNQEQNNENLQTRELSF